LTAKLEKQDRKNVNKKTEIKAMEPLEWICIDISTVEVQIKFGREEGNFGCWLLMNAQDAKWSFSVK